MRRIVTAFLALLLPLSAFILFTPAPANATTCVGDVCVGGFIGHTTDAGYDQPILIVCNWGDAFQPDGDPRRWSVIVDNGKLVGEGTTSRDDCGIDTDVIVVRDNEQISCREVTPQGQVYWRVRFDATGPHKIFDNWSERYCVVGRD